MEKLNIEAEAAGQRIDAFLADKMENISRSAVQHLLEGGYITLNGRAVKKNHKVSPGEIFEVVLSDARPVEIRPQDIPLNVVYEDDHLIVVNKERGMVVHPAPGHSEGTLVNALMYHCGDSLSGINGEIRPGIVHRLDKDTSGLIIAAKSDFAHLSLAKQLKNRSLSRIYEAVVCGGPKEDAGRINAPIGRHQNDRKRMAVTQKNSREAATSYEVITRYQGYTHVRCALETGRTHQIRVHMAHIGHPVLGDRVYGRKKPEMGLDGQCLHARAIKFIHPATGESMSLNTELPEYFIKVLEKLKTDNR